MRLKVADLLGMAGGAGIVNLLRNEQCRAKIEQQDKPHARLTNVRSIDDRLGLPARAIANFSSAASNVRTRST
ncbi:MAG: hypothetical protein WKF37_20680, partial [Bryobacteraceae bacterium]